jgi:multisubunit Na+/H+ antiporter MnhG subunit
MGLDIRIPIGAMFAILGALLAAFGAYGAVVHSEIYQKSLGINVNLWWGLVLLVFGALMFVFGRRADSRPKKTSGAPPRH